MNTKTFYFLLAIVLLSGAVVPARSQGVSLGAKAGLAISHMTNIEKSNDVIRQPFYGVAGGFVANFAFSQYASLQTELLFIQKGMRLKYTDVDSHSRTYLNWIELPVLVQGTLPAGSAEVTLSAGGYFAVSTNGKTHSKYASSGGDTETSSDKIEYGDGNYNRIDAGIPVGVGVLLKAGKGKLAMDLRYEIGFVNIQQGTGNADPDSKRHWRCGTVSLAYMLPVGR